MVTLSFESLRPIGRLSSTPYQVIPRNAPASMSADEPHKPNTNLGNASLDRCPQWVENGRWLRTESAVLQPLNHATVCRSGVVRAWLFPSLKTWSGRTCYPRGNGGERCICYPCAPRPPSDIHPRVTKVTKVTTPQYDPLRVTMVDQALGNRCLVLPQPASSFELARSISSPASRIEKALPPLNLPSSSHAIGAATGAPSRARAE